jgi:hypothetical protein
MNTDPIKELIYAEKFYPFEIVHKKRGIYRVVDREFCWVSLERPPAEVRHRHSLSRSYCSLSAMASLADSWRLADIGYIENGDWHLTRGPWILRPDNF